MSGAFSRLHERLRALLPRYGYGKPTPIQEKAIPLLLRGFSCLLVAPTGTGKTEAAVFPFMSRMLSEGGSGLRLLYITPLRSLNRDLLHRLEGIASDLGFRVLVRHGDTSAPARRAFLSNPPDIAIMTPEAFYFLLSTPRFRRVVRSVRFVVVDEVHELVYSERGVELVAALERLRRITGRRIVKAALSATVADPLEVARLISPRDYMVVVEAGGKGRLDVSVVSPRRDECGFAERLGVPADVAARLCFIVRVVSSSQGGVLVFTNTRDTAEYIGSLLKRVLGEDAVAVHHGSLSRSERVEAEEGFRRGKVKVLVATSSLELGIDIGWVDLVIQYASPRQALRLVQRVGRSRHRVGGVSKGFVVSLEGVFDEIESVVLARRCLGGDLEKPPAPLKPLDALLHQLVGMVLESEEGCVDTMEAYTFFRGLPYYRGLGFDEFAQLLDYASAARILRVRGDRVCRGRRAMRYYYSTTMIPDEVRYVVIEASTRSRVGVLDEEFAASLEEGDVFILAGKAWKVLDVGEGRVYVAPAEAEELVLPSWEGDMIPVEYAAAREMGALVRRLVEDGVPPSRLARTYPCRAELLERIAAFFRESGGPPPTDRRIVIEASGDFIFIYGFFGSRIAKALEFLLRSLIEEILGFKPPSYSTAYAILLKLTRSTVHGTAASLPRLIRGLSDEEARELIRRGMRSSRLFEWRLSQVARKMGVVEPNKTIDRKLLRSLTDTVVGVEAERELEVARVDIEGALRIINMIRENRIEVVCSARGSKLSRGLIESAPILRAARTAALPSTLLPEVYRRRLANRRVRLICLMCLRDWEAKFSELEDKPRCPNCGSRFIAPLLGVTPDEARRMLRSYRRRGQGAAKKLIELGNLVLDHGKRVIEALLVPGVGPRNVRHILSRLSLGEEAYYKALMEAEQRYLRTRRFWKHQ